MRKTVALLLGLCLLLGSCAQAPREPAPETDPPSASPSPSPAGVGREETAAQVPSPSPSPKAEEPGAAVEPDYDYGQPVPETAAVTDDYFADAAFIGDSRIDGLQIYSGLLQGDFIVATGMSVFKVETDRLTYRGEKMTALEALGRKSYKKVYLSMGINELGMYNDQGYHDHYADFVDAVRAQQPEAAIYIQLLIPVNARRCAESKMPYYITNEQIDVYNDLLRQVAQEKQVFLVDPAEALTDETGEPPYDTVTDGVHFNKPAYQAWLEYLRRHTVREKKEETQ